MLLLHGFPEFWYGWHHQIPALASAGCWVVALDQRGYNHSEKPGHISDDGIDTLAIDVAAVAQTLCTSHHRQIDLVAHDWGGAVAWARALRFPAFFRRMVILNLPHPLAMRKTPGSNLQQMAASWYMLAFPEFCYQPELEYFDDCTHWLKHEAPARVNASILRFLKA